MTRVFITGSAGLIGFHLARLLLDEGFAVHGYDGMTDYYDVALKQRRHQMLAQKPGFAATEALLEDEKELKPGHRRFCSSHNPFTSPHRRGCVIRWNSRAPISMPISSALST